MDQHDRVIVKFVYEDKPDHIPAKGKVLWDGKRPHTDGPVPVVGQTIRAEYGMAQVVEVVTAPCDSCGQHHH